MKMWTNEAAILGGDVLSKCTTALNEKVDSIQILWLTPSSARHNCPFKPCKEAEKAII